MTELSRMRVVVTAAANGICLAIARRFVRDGSVLVRVDNEAAALDAAISSFTTTGAVATPIVADLMDAAAIERAAIAAGVVDGLIKCAFIDPVTPMSEPARSDQCLLT